MKNLLILSCALSLMACATQPAVTSSAVESRTDTCDCPPYAAVATTVLDTCMCMVITAPAVDDCKCDIVLAGNAERFNALSATTNPQENIADCKCAIDGAEQSADLHTPSSDAVTWFGPKHAGGGSLRGELLACGPHCGCLNTHLIDHLSA